MTLEEEIEDVCAFCREPAVATEEEEVVQLNKLVEKGHAHACHMLAGAYANGILGLPQNWGGGRISSKGRGTRKC